MASAWFVDRERGYTRGVKLFCFKHELTEVDEVWRDGRLSAGEGRTLKTSFDDRASCVAAYEKRCEEIVAQGWVTRRRASYGEPKAPPTPAQTENELEALSAELAGALVSAAGDRAAEQAAIARAVGRYRAARAAIGEPPDEYVVHFFSVDGVGLEASRVPALVRPKPSATTFARWAELLQRLAAGPAKKPTSKPVSRKPAAKKPVSKKPAAKKPVSKTPAAKKPVSKTRAAKKAPTKSSKSPARRASSAKRPKGR